MLLGVAYLGSSLFAIFGFKFLQNLKDKENLARITIAPADIAGNSFAPPAMAELPPWQLARFLLATVALYLPLFAPLFVSLLFSIECNQAGSLIISTLSTNLSLACAVGAVLSIFLNRLARKRIILQVIALAAVTLYALGAWSHNYMTCYATLTATAAIAGLILPDWYHHLLTHFLAAKDTILVLIYALCSIPIEQTLAVVSSLYFLKELNLLGAALTALSIILAPFALKK